MHMHSSMGTWMLVCASMCASVYFVYHYVAVTILSAARVPNCYNAELL